MYIKSIDDFLSGFIGETTHPILTYLFATITYSAGYMVASIVVLLSLGAFVLHKHYLRSIALLVSTIGTSSSIYLLKFLFDLERPVKAIYLESTPSFPSGHSGLAVALYGFLILSIWKHDKHNLKYPLILFLALLILLVGASRIYLGVHYFLDVIVGYAIGLFWLYIAQKIQTKLGRIFGF